jgi:hypothetical protein
MRSRHLAATCVAAALALALSGCSGAVSAAKSQVGNAVGAGTCTAIADAKTRLATIGDADPATLDEISAMVATIDAGLPALGDKVPAGVADSLGSARAELDQAIGQAKTDPAQARASLTAAGAKVTDGLTQLGGGLGC